MGGGADDNLSEAAGGYDNDRCVKDFYGGADWCGLSANCDAEDGGRGAGYYS